MPKSLYCILFSLIVDLRIAHFTFTSLDDNAEKKFGFSLSTGEGLFVFGFLVLKWVLFWVLFDDSPMISLDKPVFQDYLLCACVRLPI